MMRARSYERGVVKLPIRDRREISFDAGSLIGIVAAHPRVTQAVGLPSGIPRDITFDVQTQAISFFYGFNGAPASIRSSALAALLIAYCVGAGIKIPRHIDREMRVEQDAVVITCSTSYMDAGLVVASSAAQARAATDWIKQTE